MTIKQRWGLALMIWAGTVGIIVHIENSGLGWDAFAVIVMILGTHLFTGES